jgi:hypothetical protein
MEGRAGGTGSIGRDGGGGGVRAGLNGRAGDGGSGGQAGRAGSDERCGVDRSGSWTVGPLGPGDGPLVHHPR